jgi:hypothetical protein
VKTVFLIQGFNVAASRLRVLQYLPHLHAEGVDTEVFEFPRGMKGWAAMLGPLRRADVVFVQRKRLPLYVLLLLRRMGKKVVYDFDDAVMFKNSLSPNPYSLRRKMSFRRMLRFTDLVIAGNEFLREEAEKCHPLVRVLPTPVDALRYRGKAYEEREKVNIGWIGDHGSIHYMESYKDVWEELGARYGGRVALTIICDTFIDTKKIETRKVPWTYEKEVEHLMDLDIGVMPLFDDLWSQGKCGFKIIQYLGVGVPAVCTPVGINRDVVDDGVNGFWARTREEWVEKLALLIEAPALRAGMGREGRRKIMEHYTVQACAPKLAEWMKAL